MVKPYDPADDRFDPGPSEDETQAELTWREETTEQLERTQAVLKDVHAAREVVRHGGWRTVKAMLATNLSEVHQSLADPNTTWERTCYLRGQATTLQYVLQLDEILEVQKDQLTEKVNELSSALLETVDNEAEGGDSDN